VRPGRAADHSPPSSAAVMEEYSYNSTHPLGHTGPVTGSLYLDITCSSTYKYWPEDGLVRPKIATNTRSNKKHCFDSRSTYFNSF